jgi:outer membrane protein TolC
MTPGPRARRTAALAVALCALLLGIAPAAAETAALVERPTPADEVLRAIEDPALRALVHEVLDRNPTVSSVAARARAARQQAPQAKALPDPVAGVTAYAPTPETRVGPQRLMGSLSQRFPWFGKRGLREQAALRLADAFDAEVEAGRLELVTQTRRIAWEIAFLDAHRGVVEMDRETLIRFEELARSRYSAGSGIQQDVVRIQAEITKDDNRLLEIAVRRVQLVAELNALRDRPAATTVPDLVLPRRPRRSPPELLPLRASALAARPELARADAEIARADRMVDIARKDYKPDFTLGAAYTAVGRRDDLAGMVPPMDDGQDVFGISLSLNLPVQRARLRAGVEEAAELRVAAEERKRDVMAGIDRALGDLVERLRLTAEQVELFVRVLVVQAEQSLHSAEAGYAAGSLSSLDLLDAERVLLDVRTATERARADNAIALARLEGAVGGPLDAGTEGAEP